ncbi:hypothetical protein TWF696_007560 [Orbilia brochopaga]|uniref:Uncharacterized protein n=1 Tax=Orbilia brochopaga TaxID=3140254 RepID=A0AAV9UKV4_9PEZI
MAIVNTAPRGNLGQLQGRKGNHLEFAFTGSTLGQQLDGLLNLTLTKLICIPQLSSRDHMSYTI